MEDLQNKLQIDIKRDFWLDPQLLQYPADSLLEACLEQTTNMYLGSEKARSEFLIAPVLLAFQRKNADNLSIFSGYEFNVDKALSLNGFCDFILSTNPNSFFLNAPIFCVVEAKKMEPDMNDLAQCGAEMYAAQIFHQKQGKPQKSVYGCATSGYSWMFMQLIDNTLLIDSRPVPLTFSNPYPPLVALQWIFNKSLANV
jgi:hypothetical protein